MRLWLAMLLVALGASHAEAAKLLQARAGVNIRWTDSEIRIGVDPRRQSQYLSNDEVKQALDGARAAWNTAPEMRLRFIPLTTASRAHVSISFCRDRWKRDTGLLAHTEFQADGHTGVVTSAVVYINECDYRFVPPDEVAGNRYDLQSVITHELGHVLGLGHSDERTAIMFALTGNASHRRPTADDRAGLAILFYAPVTASIVAPVAPIPAPPSAPTRTATTIITTNIINTAPATPARARSALPPPPSDMLAATKVESANGKSGMVYTGSATILPAIAIAPAKTEKPNTRSAKSRRR